MAFYDLIRLPGDDRYAIRKRDLIEHIFGFGRKYVDLTHPTNLGHPSYAWFERDCVGSKEKCLSILSRLTVKNWGVVGFTKRDLIEAGTTRTPEAERIASFIRPPENASRLHKICAAFYNGGINQSEFTDIYDHFKLDGKVIVERRRCGPDSPINSDAAESQTLTKKRDCKTD